MVTEPLIAFLDFGKPATLIKRDGSVTTSDVLALYDESETVEQGDFTDYREKSPEITVPADKAEPFKRDDLIKYEGRTYKIDDFSFSDGIITTFAVSLEL